MLIGEMNNIKKYYGERLLLNIDSFKLFSEDRIGIVGRNGSGKTTFLNILTGRLIPEEGKVTLREGYSYISQLEPPDGEPLGEMRSVFQVKTLGEEGRSGGENTRLKLASAMSRRNILLIADEPTSNLDREGVELLQKELKSFQGALLIVSHDREFLDELCTSILEIKDGGIKLYKGNYSKYKLLKEEERKREVFKYESYEKEKKRLEEHIYERKEKVKGIKRTPSRMGNSEARLHKMGGQKAKEGLDRAIKNLEARIERLEVSERPKEIKKAQVDIQNSMEHQNKVIFSSDALNKSFGSKIIFQDAAFAIEGGMKTAIIGTNGSGKTTLINMLIKGEGNIRSSNTLKIGYFKQDLSLLEEDKSLIENIMDSSIYSEAFVRTLLARLLFERADINKRADILSGGERVKGGICKLLVSDFNVLILDEPTNYLDIYSLEALEEALREYRGSIIFVSHDRHFTNTVADRVLAIEDKKLIGFKGGLSEYLEKRNKPKDNRSREEKRMLLENRKAEVIGRLSLSINEEEKKELDKEFKYILESIKALT